MPRPSGASGTGSGPRRRRRRGSAPSGPNHVWALDFQFDTTSDGRVLKLLHVVDEHTREALAIQVERRIDADHTVRVLDRIVARDGRRPELVRMDNGPELTANALRDWCRFGEHRHQRTSSRARPGRTRSSSRSAARSATRCSPSKPSTRCSRRRPSLKNGETPTTLEGRTQASAGRPPPPTRQTGEPEATRLS